MDCNISIIDRPSPVPAGSNFVGSGVGMPLESRIRIGNMLARRTAELERVASDPRKGETFKGIHLYEDERSIVLRFAIATGLVAMDEGASPNDKADANEVLAFLKEGETLSLVDFVAMEAKNWSAMERAVEGSKRRKNPEKNFGKIDQRSKDYAGWVMLVCVRAMMPRHKRRVK